MAENEYHHLDYGFAEPRLHRVLRQIPRLSKVSLLLILICGAMHAWFWNDHEPWVMQSNFPCGNSSLGGHIDPGSSRLLVGSVRSMAGGIIAPFQICDINSQKVLCTFGSSGEWAQSARFSSDGTRLFTIGGTIVTEVSGHSTRSSMPNNIVRLWDTFTGSMVAQYGPLNRLDSNAGTPMQAQFSPDGRRLITLENGKANFYDAATGHRVSALADVGDTVFFSPDGRLAVIERFNSPVRIVSTVDGHQIAEHALELGLFDVPCGAFAPDSKVFAVAENEWLYVLDSATGADRVPPMRLDESCSELRFSGDGNQVLVLSSGFPTTADMLTSINVGVGKATPTTRPIINALSSHVELAARARQIWLLSYNGTLEVLNAANLSLIKKVSNRRPAYSPGIFSPDESRAVTIRQNPTSIEIFSTATLQMTSSIRDRRHGMFGNFCDAAFLGNSAHLLTATDLGVVQLWKLRRPEATWGVIALPQFWLMVCTTLIAFLSIGRDIVQFRRRSIP